MPERIQRRRVKGWRAPEGAVFVGRQTMWGNPWQDFDGSVRGPAWADAVAREVTAPVVPSRFGGAVTYSDHSDPRAAAEAAVDLFRKYCVFLSRDFPGLLLEWTEPLRGKDLMCWCPIDAPCHADVLLELANRTTAVANMPGYSDPASHAGPEPDTTGGQGLAAPFPYFGGKRRAAATVWRALGDPAGYVEPFAGSAAVLLERPAFRGRRVETLNDLDGWLVNTWRAIQQSPAEVARHAGGPVMEIDYHARLAWLQERRTDGLVSWLEGDPEVYDAKAAGWWLYVAACGIGDPWGAGPWHVIDGRLTKLPKANGRRGTGIERSLPDIGTAGKGINRELPHLGTAGMGVNRAFPAQGEHDRALAAYMTTLAERICRVRITCGSWERVVKPSAIRAGAGGDGARAVFLDPPYATSGDLYASSADDSGEISANVRRWCTTVPEDLRVILCGYENEHDELLTHGWTVTEGKANGGAGYNTDPLAGRRERLWMSPACITHKQEAFDLEGLAS
ncbi:DUF4326 domain-containing protein [Arthrobacter sp. NPDC090010]|uniref:DUF4326 domain-containing protein n=1 Tax=Arthrobacter sp. NPDC090010 TaxID=3363942 RepID=UPI00382BE8A4